MPWFGYTTKIGPGTGSPTVSGAVNAGSSTIPTTGWTGSDPKLGQDAMVSFGNPPFVYRVLVRGHRRVADFDRSAETHGSTSTPAPRSPTRPIPSNGVWLVTTMRLRNSSDVYGAMIAPKLVQGIVLEFIESIREGLLTMFSLNINTQNGLDDRLPTLRAHLLALNFSSGQMRICDFHHDVLHESVEWDALPGGILSVSHIIEDFDEHRQRLVGDLRRGDDHDVAHATVRGPHHAAVPGADARAG